MYHRKMDSPVIKKSHTGFAFTFEEKELEQIHHCED